MFRFPDTAPLAERMHFILEPAYEKCVKRQFNLGARKRIEDGVEYDMDAFEAYWKADHFADGQDAVNVRDAVINARLARNRAGMEWR